MPCLTTLIPIICCCFLSSRFALSLGMILSTSVVDNYQPTDALISSTEIIDGALDDKIDEKRFYPNPMFDKIPGSKISLKPNMKKLLILLTDLMNKNKLNIKELINLFPGDVKMSMRQPEPRYLYRFPFRRFRG